MENSFYLKLFLTSLVLILVPLKIAAHAMRSRKNKPNLPPGPWKLPVIGNLHQLAGSLPHQRLRDLARKHGDLMHLQLGELSYVIVSSAEVAREMMRTHDAQFAQRSLQLAGEFYTSKSLGFAPYGEYWRQLKKICMQEMLSPASVRSFQSVRAEEASSLIKRLRSASGTPVNISEKLLAMNYAITARAAFGKKSKAVEDTFAASLDNFFNLASSGAALAFPSQKWLLWITGLGTKLEKQFKILDGIIEEVVESCVADRAEESTKRNSSLLAVLLDIEEKGDPAIQLDAKNIRSIMLDMLGGGSHTTSTAIEWAMFELMRNPTVMEKAQVEVRQVFSKAREVDEAHFHELNYLDFVIKETLRLHPPEALVARECIESCALNGYNIPVKTLVLINAWAIGRDSRYWTDPEKFNPDRFINSKVNFRGTDFEFIPFGSGRRICAGITFAISSIKLPLAYLLFHFDWKLPKGIHVYNDDDDIERMGLTIRLRDSLYSIPISRANNDDDEIKCIG